MADRRVCRPLGTSGELCEASYGLTNRCSEELLTLNFQTQASCL